MNEQEEYSGIDIDNAHPRAIELIPEAFFWSSVDELSPFGSDEGFTALVEYRDWRRDNPETPTIECLKWVIESVGEINYTDYNHNLLDKKLLQSQIDDDDFDDYQYVYTLDNSVIATGFGQLVDEGKIEEQNKVTILLAIDRQRLWAGLLKKWKHAKEYLNNLQVLERALSQA